MFFYPLNEASTMKIQAELAARPRAPQADPV